MFEEDFTRGESCLHHLDPRIKIISTIIYTFCIAVLQNLPTASCALLSNILLWTLSKLPLKKVCGRLVLVNGFIFFFWLFLPFSTPGTPIFSIFTLTVSKQGIIHSALITVKANAIFLGIITIISTSPIPALGKALYDLRVPSKLTFLILISYRYLNVIYGEYQKLSRSMEIRGFVPGTNLHTYKTFGYLFAMVLIKSYDRAQRVYQAMLLQGFQGKFYYLHEFTVLKKDICFFLYIAIFIFALLAIDILETL